MLSVADAVTITTKTDANAGGVKQLRPQDRWVRKGSQACRQVVAAESRFLQKEKTDEAAAEVLHSHLVYTV